MSELPEDVSLIVLSVGMATFFGILAVSVLLCHGVIFRSDELELMPWGWPSSSAAALSRFFTECASLMYMVRLMTIGIEKMIVLEMPPIS
jgi:hypothetical protein